MYVVMQSAHGLWYYQYITADGLAVDWISDKLYYSDDCSNDIGVLDLATNQYKMLVSESDIGNHSYCHDVAVDSTTRLHIILQSLLQQ